MHTLNHKINSEVKSVREINQGMYVCYKSVQMQNYNKEKRI